MVGKVRCGNLSCLGGLGRKVIWVGGYVFLYCCVTLRKTGICARRGPRGKARIDLMRVSMAVHDASWWFLFELCVRLRRWAVFTVFRASSIAFVMTIIQH